MSHEVEVVNNVAHTFGVKETPWHRLGAVLPEAPTLEEALTLMHCDWEVYLKPLYAAPPALEAALADKAEGNVVAHSALERVAGNATYRADTDAFLGVVGPRYEPLQNMRAFKVFEPLLDEGIATVETGGVLRDGKDVWMLVRFQEDKLLPPTREWLDEEGIQPYGLLTNNHSGWSAVRLGMTPVRVVCWNTLTAAMFGRGIIKVRHVGDVEAKVVDAAEEAFGSVVKRYAGLTTMFRALRRQVLDDKLFEEIVLNAAAPLPKPKPDESAEAARDRARDRTIDRRDALRLAWTDGKGHTGDLSAFEAYSGLVEVLDHSPLYEGRTVNRVESMALGQVASIKNRAFNALVKVAVPAKK